MSNDQKNLLDMSVEEMDSEIRAYLQPETGSFDKEENYVFVSYSHDDREKVYRKVLSWIRAGYNVYLDLDFDNRTDDWAKVMCQRITDNCCCLAVCFTSNYYYRSYAALIELLTMRSEETRQEREHAYDTSREVPIKTIIIEQFNPSMEGGQIKAHYNERLNAYKELNKGMKFLENKKNERALLIEGLGSFLAAISSGRGRVNKVKYAEKALSVLQKNYENGIKNFYPNIAGYIKSFLDYYSINHTQYDLSVNQSGLFTDCKVFNRFTNSSVETGTVDLQMEGPLSPEADNATEKITGSDALVKANHMGTDAGGQTNHMETGSGVKVDLKMKGTVSDHGKKDADAVFHVAEEKTEQTVASQKAKTVKLGDLTIKQCREELTKRVGPCESDTHKRLAQEYSNAITAKKLKKLFQAWLCLHFWPIDPKNMWDDASIYDFAFRQLDKLGWNLDTEAKSNTDPDAKAFCMDLNNQFFYPVFGKLAKVNGKQKRGTISALARAVIQSIRESCGDYENGSMRSVCEKSKEILLDELKGVTVEADGQIVKICDGIQMPIFNDPQADKTAIVYNSIFKPLEALYEMNVEIEE